MARSKKTNNDSDAIRLTLERYLLQRERQSSAQSQNRLLHFDEDTLAAFTEGTLSTRESAPLISHLVACHPCRRATTQLLRLEYELGESELPQRSATAQSEPGRIRKLLETLAARVLPGTDEEVVFAYHSPAEDLERAEKDKDGNSQAPVSEADSSTDQKEG